jgi:hypothetical protein
MPIDGAWENPYLRCCCDTHRFLYFAEGRVLSFATYHPPPEWWGTYERIGFHTYRVSFGSETNLVRSHLLLLRVMETPVRTRWIGRDLLFSTVRRTLKMSEQRTAVDVLHPSFEVTVRNGKVTAGGRYGPFVKPLNEVLSRLSKNARGTEAVRAYVRPEVPRDQLATFLAGLKTAGFHVEVHSFEELRVPR